MRFWFKWLLRAGVALVGIGVLILGGFWWLMQQPLYHPGILAETTGLDPVAERESAWEVAPGVVLPFLKDGDGAPVLVVHGGPGQPVPAPAPAFHVLQGAFSVYYYDQRGAGRATRLFDRFPQDGSTWSNIQSLESNLGIGQQLADIERVRRLLDVEKLVLIGHSYGALLAALYAAELPGRVDRLVLLNPADLLVFPPKDGGLFGAVRARLPANEIAAYDAWQEQYLDLQGAFIHSASELQALDARFADWFAKASAPHELPMSPGTMAGAWHARAQYFSMGQRHDWRGFLSRISAPTLIVHGSEDIQPEAVAEMYAVSIPGARLAVLSGAGHFPQYSHEDVLSDLLKTFLVTP